MISFLIVNWFMYNYLLFKTTQRDLAESILCTLRILYSYILNTVYALASVMTL